MSILKNPIPRRIGWPVVILASIFLQTGCLVPKKQLTALQEDYEMLKRTNTKIKKENRALKEQIVQLQDSIVKLWQRYPVHAALPQGKGTAKASDTNSAAGIDWLTPEEKNVYYYLNMARMDPKGFFKKYVADLYKNDPNNEYLWSLSNTMNSMKALEPLLPDKKMYESARCHAYSSGVHGYVGHTRQTKNCPGGWYGECCSYGEDTGLEVVLQLLIDEGVPSLGHRFICFGSYSVVGVSMMPHSIYGTNTVLDFK